MGWREITGDTAWENAAASHKAFWNLVSKIEPRIRRKIFQEGFSRRSSVFAKVVRRYILLLALRKSTELREFNFEWSDVSASMWEDTKDLRSQSAGEEITGSAAVITREQFSFLTEAALKIIKEGRRLSLDAEFIKCIINDEIFYKAISMVESGKRTFDTPSNTNITYLPSELELDAGAALDRMEASDTGTPFNTNTKSVPNEPELDASVLQGYEPLMPQDYEWLTKLVNEALN
eukprot:Gregarina_sp_Poly_1__490@NODE_111_length_13906_cov_58_362887_g98_i0_p5_GENE_NODE_111_length_13906_cov_58_362887_g98_i0NODE_111_length_13906_cov_58_362887_g98_i0_p5_ORF_typecomplete_len234_score21_77_NODE_111_length_13906_cov_58_362887_g98_i01182212523